MADIAMCEDWDCPNQDSCWRLLAPPDPINQCYHPFEFDEEAFESGKSEHGCVFYINSETLHIK